MLVKTGIKWKGQNVWLEFEEHADDPAFVRGRVMQLQAFVEKRLDTKPTTPPAKPEPFDPSQLHDKHPGES